MDIQTRKLKQITLQTPEEIQKLQNEWNALYYSAEIETVFQSWDWCFSWIETFYDPEIHQLIVITLYDKEKLVFIFPFVGKQEKSGKWQYSIIGYELADYSDILVHPNYKKQLSSEFKRVLKQNKIHHLFFRFIPQWSPLQDVLKDCRKSSEITIYEDVGFKDSFFYIDIPETWEEYSQEISQKHRRNIRRANKRMEEENITFKFLKSASEEEMSNIIAFHCTSLKTSQNVSSTFEDPKNRAFLLKVLPRLFKMNAVSLIVFEKENELVQIALQFATNKRWLGYMTGTNFNYGHISPGKLAIYHILLKMIEKQIPIFDLGWGGEPYKSHWAEKISYPISVHIIRENIIIKYYNKLRNKIRLRTRMRNFFKSFSNQ